MNCVDLGRWNRKKSAADEPRSFFIESDVLIQPSVAWMDKHMEVRRNILVYM